MQFILNKQMWKWWWRRERMVLSYGI